MSQVTVSKSILQWALSRQGTPMSKFKKKFPKLNEWVSGSSSPTLKQVEALAKATHTPFGYFFLDQPPKDILPIPHFRTIDDEHPEGPSPDLLETVQSLQRRQSWIREYLLEQSSDRLSFVGSCKSNDSPKDVAQKILSVLNLESDWASKQDSWTQALGILRNAMEDAGIIVIVNGVVGNNTKRVLDVEEFRGFVLSDDYAPVIFINGADGKAAQMFTLAHELAHVFMGSSAAFDLREMQAAEDPTEQACNKVAAELLVPEVELRNLWTSIKNTKDPFQRVSRNFKVSFLVAIRRGLDLGIISKSQFFTHYNNYISDERRNKKTSSGGNFYASQNLKIGRRFGHTVLQAVREGRLLYSDAYRLTGLSGSSFSKFAKSQGLEV